jgi:[ribosomal protein S5]-alanine N-acetyltransferase
MQLTKFLVGSRVTLGVLSGDADLESYAAWVNDPETTGFMAVGAIPVSVRELRDYIRKHAAAKNALLLGIYLNRNERHIGNISLHDIQWKDRHGEIGILIGDKRSRGKGYGTEAIRLLVEHAFGRLNLNKIYCGMVERNEASLRAFKRIGFKVEGVLRQHFFSHGKYMDCYRLGLLRDEYVNQ